MICNERHPVTLMRCWVRVHKGKHDGEHLAVLKNHDTKVCQRPQVVRWT